MRLELTGRRLRITPDLRRVAEERLEKLEHLLHERGLSLQVVLSAEHNRPRAEMTLHARGDRFFHATGAGITFPAAMNQALAKINQQARKLKGKWDDGKRRGVSPVKTSSTDATASVSASAEAPARASKATPRIIRVRTRAAKPMTVEDAAAEIGEGRDAVLVFRNSATDGVAVLFRRHDGHLGLIEP